jgi:hypothetical protein
METPEGAILFPFQGDFLALVKNYFAATFGNKREGSLVCTGGTSHTA